MLGYTEHTLGAPSNLRGLQSKLEPGTEGTATINATCEAQLSKRTYLRASEDPIDIPSQASLQ